MYTSAFFILAQVMCTVHRRKEHYPRRTPTDVDDDVKEQGPRHAAHPSLPTGPEPPEAASCVCGLRSWRIVCGVWSVLCGGAASLLRETVTEPKSRRAHATSHGSCTPERARRPRRRPRVAAATPPRSQSRPRHEHTRPCAFLCCPHNHRPLQSAAWARTVTHGE